MKNFNLAILTSHPIQYQAPFFRELNKNPNINLNVYFKKKRGIKPKLDKQFNVKVKWDIPLLDGYNYKFLSNKLSIVKELNKNNFDAVLIYGWNSLINWITALACFLIGVPVLIQSESPLNQEKKKKGLKQIIKKFFLKNFLFKYCLRLLYIGDQNKNFYKHFNVPDSKLFFTPYAVDNERFQKSYKKLKSSKQRFRNKLNIKSDDIAILFVGKLMHKKRPNHLLKSYKKLNDRGVKNIHLIFVGSGRLENNLKEYRDKNNLENIHFLGFKNQTELPKYYTIADIFVLPSGTGETWGLVVNEAMNFKLPIVISDVPGSGYDLVKEGENGYKFSLGNISELSSKLEKLIKDSKKRKEFGKKSFEIIKDYNYEKDIEGILKALKSIK